MARTLRYGIVGCGVMGREHIANLDLIPGSEVAALADPFPGSLEAAAALAGKAATYADYREMLAQVELDALIVATPNHTHREVLEHVFSGPPLALLVEKPLCTTAADVPVLRAAAAAYPAPIWVAMEYRYMPPLARLVEEVRAGTVGRVRMLALREHRNPFLVKVGDWNRFARNTGGTLVEKCCHFFDLMRFILQDEPVRVYASGAQDVNHLDERYDGETPDILDNAFVVVDFARGARALLDLCMFADGSRHQEEIAATGERGKVECFVPASEVVLSSRMRDSARVIPVPVEVRLLAAGHHHASTYYEHLGFRRAVLDGGPVEVSVEDGLRAVLIGLAAEESVKRGQPVPIDPALWG